MLTSVGGWCPKDTDDSPYIQIDLLTPHTITKVDTQGGYGNYVEKFKLTFSYDNTKWFDYTVHGKVKVSYLHLNIAKFDTEVSK